MKSISRFEANLLRLLRGVFQEAPIEQVAPLVAKPMPRPKCLSRDAVELIEDTLAKGCVQWIARRGFARERFLGDGRPVDGRLWQRHEPVELALTFSAHALEFLLQLASGTVGAFVPKTSELTIGDRLLYCLVYDRLRFTEAAETLRKKWTPLHEDGLCRLAFVDSLLDDTQRFRIDWSSWSTGPGVALLEAAQGWLSDRWTAIERKKESVAAPAFMRTLGQTQVRVLGEYLDAIDRAQRRDLARCLLDTGRRILHEPPDARKWIGQLDVARERLAERQRLYQDALAVIRQMERLQTWHREAQHVSYVDEGYQASQVWKADWERFDGDRICAHASEVVAACGLALVPNPK